MDTITIQINNSRALRLIKDLEALDLIKILEKPLKKEQKKLSDLLAGSITKRQAKVMHEELLQMRNEWERSTY